MKQIILVVLLACSTVALADSTSVSVVPVAIYEQDASDIPEIPTPQVPERTITDKIGGWFGNTASALKDKAITGAKHLTTNERLIKALDERDEAIQYAHRLEDSNRHYKNKIHAIETFELVPMDELTQQARAFCGLIIDMPRGEK